MEKADSMPFKVFQKLGKCLDKLWQIVHKMKTYWFRVPSQVIPPRRKLQKPNTCHYINRKSFCLFRLPFFQTKKGKKKDGGTNTLNWINRTNSPWGFPGIKAQRGESSRSGKANQNRQKASWVAGPSWESEGREESTSMGEFKGRKHNLTSCLTSGAVGLAAHP